MKALSTPEDQVRHGPVAVELFMDFHCPYSYRVTCWLDDLAPGLVEVAHRFFALEQVNHDPDAGQWRLWEQPLDYRQYRDRQDRRALSAFLAAAAVDASDAGPDARRRFRRAVYGARFEGGLDISDPVVLDDAGVIAGLPRGWIREALAGEAVVAAARARIASDWVAARAPYRVFGVPTIRFGDAAPIYVRLAASVPPAEGHPLLAAFLAFRTAAPIVLEVKEPEPAPEPAPEPRAEPGA